MTTAKKPGGKATNKKKTTKKAAPPPATQDVWTRTGMLVEILLKVMEREMRTRDKEPSVRWRKLFGSKDSAVVNLQKLVQLLGELQAQHPGQVEELVAPVDAAELAILADWLRTTNAASVSTAKE